MISWHNNDTKIKLLPADCPPGIWGVCWTGLRRTSQGCCSRRWVRARALKPPLGDVHVPVVAGEAGRHHHPWPACEEALLRVDSNGVVVRAEPKTTGRFRKIARGLAISGSGCTALAVEVLGRARGEEETGVSQGGGHVRVIMGEMCARGMVFAHLMTLPWCIYPLASVQQVVALRQAGGGGEDAAALLCQGVGRQQDGNPKQFHLWNNQLKTLDRRHLSFNVKSFLSPAAECPRPLYACKKYSAVKSPKWILTQVRPVFVFCF